MPLQKSRILMLAADCNPGKVSSLETLLVEYVAYVRFCVERMLEHRMVDLPRSQKQAFFARAERLSSQIEKNARDHAIGIVSGWFRSAYTHRLRSHISRLLRAGEIDAIGAEVLHAVGRGLRSRPDLPLEPCAVERYWDLLLSVVSAPEITERIGMRMSEMTCRLEAPTVTTHTDLWLRISTLERRRSVWLPLVGSAYVSCPEDVRKGFLARKTRKGRWRFEVLDVREWEVPEPAPDVPKVGVDVGLNVVAATSDGRLYGTELKPEFDRQYQQVRSVRANRQRQGLTEDSPRLARLEERLTGLVKTVTGTVANRIVADHPGSILVIEDLDLSGCRGQKRFAYRALHHALQTKVPVEVVNPAYTSQTCPSCGHVSRKNRRNTQFTCVSCGRRAHADVVGAKNLLGRSEDNEVGRDDPPPVVGALLRGRSRQRRASPSAALFPAPVPSGRRLTTAGPGPPGGGTALNRA
jgi:putative transposase